MRRGPYISMITNRTTNLLIRAAMLFMVGVFLALVLNLLQVQRNVTLFPPDVITSIFSSAWWVPPCCGTAAVRVQSESGKDPPGLMKNSLHHGKIQNKGVRNQAGAP
ncbi:insulin-induced gene 2 protein-like [Labeo rohita]|uniref:Insulin-induced gene protein n=1 Tax=Labeo rohita TaxID=84645 RepID=A0A498LFQ8_LABRO|nr:insulin-induced gene 2 protein-like [Labeo rohita]